MPKLRYVFIALGMLLSPVPPSAAQLSVGIGLPNVSIGFTLREYPDFAVVPGYPVYYAPQLDANLFFYDGMYWLYLDDGWYESTWYNGPWYLVDPFFVPEFVLRIPVRYYRRPPAFFVGWRFDAPPRWGDHWGHDWERRRGGWDRWNRRTAPAPAPLPIYQRQYSGDRYPRQVEQQLQLQERNYRYQPRDPVVRQHYQEQRAVQRAPGEERTRERNIERPTQDVKPAPRSEPNQTQPQRKGSEGVQSPTPQERPESQERRQPQEDRGSRQQNIQRLTPRQEEQAVPREQPPRAPEERQRDIQRPTPRQEEQAAPRPQPPRAPEERPRDIQRPAPRQDIPSAPRPPSPQRSEDVQKPTPFSPPQGRPEPQERRQPPPPQMEQREQQQMPRSQGREERPQGRDATREPQREQGEQRGRGRGRDE